jgi:hypothetical protein
MARQPLVFVEFPKAKLVDLDGSGRRRVVTKLTNQDIKPLDVDEELGILYFGDRRCSIHSESIGDWRVYGPPVAKKVAK